jgi:hypothetical protein
MSYGAKHFGSSYTVDGKKTVYPRTHYHRDREFDKLLNPLTEKELVQLVKDYQLYKKKLVNRTYFEIDDIIDNPKKFYASASRLQKALDKYRTPLIEKFRDLQKRFFLFTDHSDKVIESYLMESVQDQLERRRLRELFGEDAEKLYPYVYKSEVIKPKYL